METVKLTTQKFNEIIANYKREFSTSEEPVILPFYNHENTIIWCIEFYFTTSQYKIELKFSHVKFKHFLEYFKCNDDYYVYRDSEEIVKRINFLANLKLCNCGNPIIYGEKYCNNCDWFSERIESVCCICLDNENPIINNINHCYKTTCCHQYIHWDCYKNIKNKNTCFWCRKQNIRSFALSESDNDGETVSESDNDL